MNPLTRLSPRFRFIGYCVIFILDVIVGATEHSYDKLELLYPTWLTVADTVLKYLTAIGFVAALSNVPTSKDDAGSTESE